jgi:hypothetical protein
MQESSFGFVDQHRLDPWSLYLGTRGGDRDPFGMDLATDLANSVQDPVWANAPHAP